MSKNPDNTETTDFLSRWSTRKQQEKNLPEQAEQTATEITPAQSLDEEQTASVDPPQLTDEDMPAIEDLDENSDYSMFLSPAVSDSLRRLAMRKLFSSQLFNVRDGLDDYDEDFRDFTALGELITSDMKHQMELAEQRRLDAEQQSQVDSEQLSDEQTEDDANVEVDHQQSIETDEQIDQITGPAELTDQTTVATEPEDLTDNSGQST